MRTRIPITAEQILEALAAANGDKHAAAAKLDVSTRTLERRIADYDIRSKVEFRVGEAA